MSRLGGHFPFDRSFPRHSTNGSKRERERSRANSTDQARLSVIIEDGVGPVDLPQRTHHRQFSRGWNFGAPPRHSYEDPPPHYSVWDVLGPKGEKLVDVRNNKYIAGRGGFKRICIIALLVVVVIVALVVGLVVGLRKDKHTNQPAPAKNNGTAAENAPFPAGSYSLVTFLDRVSTNCTTDTESWKCDPSTTYSVSPAEAMATFNWIIYPSGPNFTISSTSNPFAIDFANTTLTLVDENSPNERYTFDTPVQKVGFPDFKTKCYFNGTRFTGNLYTKKPKSYSGNENSTSTATSPSASSAATPLSTGSTTGVNAGEFKEWEYAIDAAETISGGLDTPACYSYTDGENGARIDSGPAQAPGNECSCSYQNYGP